MVFATFALSLMHATKLIDSTGFITCGFYSVEALNNLGLDQFSVQGLIGSVALSSLGIGAFESLGATNCFVLLCFCIIFLTDLDRIDSNRSFALFRQLEMKSE